MNETKQESTGNASETESKPNKTSRKDFILSCLGNTEEAWTKGDAIGLSVCFIITLSGLLMLVYLKALDHERDFTGRQDNMMQTYHELELHP